MKRIVDTSEMLGLVEVPEGTSSDSAWRARFLV